MGINYLRVVCIALYITSYKIRHLVQFRSDRIVDVHKTSKKLVNTSLCMFSHNNKMKRFLRTALMSVRFLFLILLPLAVTIEQEYCMREDYTNVAIPFRSLYGGKFNL
jgi:hypothetical protein